MSFFDKWPYRIYTFSDNLYFINRTVYDTYTNGLVKVSSYLCSLWFFFYVVIIIVVCIRNLNLQSNVYRLCHSRPGIHQTCQAAVVNYYISHMPPCTPRVNAVLTKSFGRKYILRIDLFSRLDHLSTLYASVKTTGDSVWTNWV